MKLSALLSYLDEADTMPESWGTVVLVRERRESASSPKAYTVLPVIDIKSDDGGRSVEIVSAEPVGKRRVKELTAKETTARLKRLASTHASARLFVSHPGRERARVAGAAADEDLTALAFLEWFKGIDKEL